MYDGTLTQALTVSMLNRYVKLLLESDRALNTVWVSGEISGVSINRGSGHLYCTLKDEKAAVRAVCFRQAADRLRFIPKDGMDVIVLGKANLFERDGQFQFIIEDILPQGIGTQNKYLRELKSKLESEGLFNQERKRALPRYPRNIALISAGGSAAVADIKTTVAVRYPVVKMTVFSVYVQGLNAESSIVRAIEEVNKSVLFDVVIIARGGGSKEDLSCFDSERVIRAAAMLRIPFISAVGHETDQSLLDLAADLRASTPTAAAVAAVPDRDEILSRLQALTSVLTERLKQRIESSIVNVRSSAVRCFVLMNSLIRQIDVQLQSAKNSLYAGVIKELVSRRQRLQSLAGVIQLHSPLDIIGRGYAYVEHDRARVTSIRVLRPGNSISLFFNDGRATCSVTEVDSGVPYE